MDTLEKALNKYWLILEARVWIGECVWGDLEPEDIASLSDAQIHAGINRHYAGGWAQFVSDGE